MDARQSLLNWLNASSESSKGTFILHLAKNISPSGRASSLFPIKPISIADLEETMEIVRDGFEIQLLDVMKLDSELVDLDWNEETYDEHEVIWELHNETSGTVAGNTLLASITYPRSGVGMDELATLLLPSSPASDGSPWFNE